MLAAYAGVDCEGVSLSQGRTMNRKAIMLTAG